MTFPIILAWSSRPTFFYDQQAGTVVNVTEKTKRSYSRKSDVYVFKINEKEIEINKRNGKNYDCLTGKSVKYKSKRDSDSEYFVEIIYNNQTVYSTNEDNKWLFSSSLTISVLILSWLVFIFAKTWKTISVEKIEEEYFFDDWGVYKKADKYRMSYISKLTKKVIHRNITEEEFVLVKNRKMKFDDFREKYNLW
ncbi:hypothetical protein AGMMS4957_19140 [Bacteroidia bacterium]|nr:hypothetical protein AGMMS4957_19140 [Bacteroidia bacterium]